MSNIINESSNPIVIPYEKNTYGYSNPSRNKPQYSFELKVEGHIFGTKYFKKIEEYKYTELINFDHKIKLSELDTYELTLILIDFNSCQENIQQIQPIQPIETVFKLTGNISKDTTHSTQHNNNLYIEFTKNSAGYTLCTCFYTRLANNKIFISPPN
jgi:hypothetical protein